MVLHFLAAMLGAPSIASCGSGATGSRATQPPSPSNLDRSSRSKCDEPPPPLDSAFKVVGCLAWPSHLAVSMRAIVQSYGSKNGVKGKRWEFTVASLREESWVWIPSSGKQGQAQVEPDLGEPRRLSGHLQ